VHRAVLLAGLLLASTTHAGPVLDLESPVEQVTVAELFTSHGCSSCPPADRWLRQLIDHPGLWDEVIPLSFHVDYWDRLGWPDRFASPRFSQRQRDYRAAGHLSGVYTPALVIKGREWRGFFRREHADLSPGPATGRLSLRLDGAGDAELGFDPVAVLPPSPLTAHLVLLGFGLSTSVTGGENAGRTLEEDFVVLGYTASTPSHERRWNLRLPPTKTSPPSRQAVAAWISAGTDPTPIQAVAGWIPKQGHGSAAAQSGFSGLEQLTLYHLPQDRRPHDR
jgi:hypothetical protein